MNHQLGLLRRNDSMQFKGETSYFYPSLHHPDFILALSLFREKLHWMTVPTFNHARCRNHSGQVWGEYVDKVLLPPLFDLCGCISVISTWKRAIFAFHHAIHGYWLNLNRLHTNYHFLNFVLVREPWHAIIRLDQEHHRNIDLTSILHCGL